MNLILHRQRLGKAFQRLLKDRSERGSQKPKEKTKYRKVKRLEADGSSPIKARKITRITENIKGTEKNVPCPRPEREKDESA